MGFEYKMTAATDTGRVRASNEDSIRIVPSINFAIVADGMGGHNAGDIASRMAVNSLCEHFENQAMTGKELANTVSLNTLAEAFSAANSLVYANSYQMKNCDGMGTTLLAASFQPETVNIGHIGDSRIYCFSHGELEQLTVDHTLAAELGSVSSDWEIPAYSHHVLRKALGIEPGCHPDFFTVLPQDNQIFLMCTDGLTGVVSDQDLSTILALRGHQPEYCVETMIDACLENGAPDNISIVLIFVSKR